MDERSAVGERSTTRQPLFWAALAFAAGIVSGTYFWRPALWWLIAAVVFAVAAVRFRGPQPWRAMFAWAMALVAVATLGAWSVESHRRPPLPDITPFTDGAAVTVTAHVVRDGVVRGQGARQRQTVDLETEEIWREGMTPPLVATIRLSLFGPSVEPQPEGDDSPDHHRGSEDAESKVHVATDSPQEVLPQSLVYGQRLRFPVKLREPRNFQNPGAWDYRGYLLRQGIVATGAVSTKKLELLPGRAGSRAGWWLSRARRSVTKKIHILWPQPASAVPVSTSGMEADQPGLFDAILIGDRTFLSRQTNAAWQRTGLYHILVVDGLKVGIFSFFVFAILRRLRAGEGLATVMTIMLSAGYAWLTELGTPAVRSVLMLSVYLLTRLLHRERALLNAIGAAALAVLVADPGAIFDASFQLSFLSVVAIAGLSVPLVQRTSQPYRRGLRWLLSPAYDQALPPRIAQFRLDLRLLSDRIAAVAPIRREWARRATTRVMGTALNWALSLYEVAVISAVLQLALTLPMAFYFHRATVVGVPANAIAVPLTSVLVTTAAVALGLAYVWPPLAGIPAHVASWSLAGITATAKLFDGFRLADVRLPTPSLAATIAGAAAFIAAMLLIRRRAVLAAAGLLILAGVSAWLCVPSARPEFHAGMLEVTSIDVGQAESTLLVTPEGRTVLVDAAGSPGPFQSDFDFGENVIAPYLWSRGFTRLDVLVLTHAHSDHMGGMPSLIASFHPRELWLGPNAPSSELAGVLETALRHRVEVVPRRAGQRIEYGGARFEVLAPPPGWQLKAKPQNNDSLVLRVTFGETSALLTGDAEKKIERYLAELRPRATLLKLGHDGSRTSTIPEFLQAVRPSVAFVSVGTHNSFGHPALEVLQRLSTAHVRTYRTDTQGGLTFLLDGKTLVAKPAVLR